MNLSTIRCTIKRSPKLHVNRENEIALQKLVGHRDYLMGINTYVGSHEFPTTDEWKERICSEDTNLMYVYMVGEIAKTGLHVHPHGNISDLSKQSLEEAELQIVLKQPAQSFLHADFIRGIEGIEAMLNALSADTASIITTAKGEQRLRLVYPIFEKTVRTNTLQYFLLLIYKIEYSQRR